MTHPAINLCLAGRISPAVALARLFLDGMSPGQVEAVLPERSSLAEVFAAHRGRLDTLALMISQSGTDHHIADPASGDAVTSIAGMFDRAVALAPEASVAAYSLGDADLLATATDELVDWLLAEKLGAAHSNVLDLGCGIGRVAAALAPHVHAVTGIDVSAGMIAEARRRHSASNLRFELVDGSPADHLPDASFDLILAVDSMPYLVQAGIASAHVATAARLLRRGGRIVICNLSYRLDVAADAETAREWASAFALRITTCGGRPFRLWDGSVFVLGTND